MKKLLSALLAVMLIVFLTACQSQEFTAKEPPALTITDEMGQQIKADLGTHEWNYAVDGGKWSGVCADSSHPLEWEMAPLVTNGDTVELSFEVWPQSLTVRCWSDSRLWSWDSLDALAQTVSLEGGTMELKEGGYVYEVIAVWAKDGNASHGTVRYGFYVVKDDHIHAPAQTSQTVEETVGGYCGNTLTTISIDGKDYTFMGSDSVYLTDLLRNLKYDPDKLCRCIPEFTVQTEFGGPYEINLTQGYARCALGQADLTVEQIQRIRSIKQAQ